jgi:hypothetical protein
MTRKQSLTTMATGEHVERGDGKLPGRQPPVLDADPVWEGTVVERG